jgi:hypothetical protein
LQKVLGEEHRRSEKRSVRALALLHDEEGAEVLDDFFVLDARVAGKNHIRVWEYVRGLVLRERERERERESSIRSRQNSSAHSLAERLLASRKLSWFWEAFLAGRHGAYASRRVRGSVFTA